MACTLAINNPRTLIWQPCWVQVAALLAAYTLAMFACYSLVPFVLRWSGAAVLNLSLLSSNLWAALARALLLGRSTLVAFTVTSEMSSWLENVFPCDSVTKPCCSTARGHLKACGQARRVYKGTTALASPQLSSTPR